MKKLFFTLLTCSIAYSATAQDASQPAGTWYLGAGDATELFNMFSAEGVQLSPFVAYTVADNIAVTVGLDYSTTTITAGGIDVESSMNSISVGAAYFFGDNYYGQVGISMGGTTNNDDTVDDTSSNGWGLALGKFIPVRDMWYVSPRLVYESGGADMGGGVEVAGGTATIGIAFGARF